MTLCRCCRCYFDQDICKDLFSKYFNSSKEEVYSVMIQECFGIALAVTDENTICDFCINNLRNAINFKDQILNSEKTLMNILGDIKDDIVERVKEEVTLECEDDYQHSFASDFLFKAEPIFLEVGVKRRVSKARDDKEDSIQIKAERKTRKGVLKEKTTKNLVLNNKKNDVYTQIVKLKRKTTKRKVDTNIFNIITNTNCTPFFGKDLSGFLCSYCRKGFKDLPDLRQHTTTEHDKRKFPIDKGLPELSVKVDITDLKCALCSTPSENIASVKKHLMEAHRVPFYTEMKDYIQEFRLPSDGVFQCVSCHSKFETFKMLLQHMNRHYRNFVCEICDAGFINYSRYRCHKVIHKTESYKCTFCDKAFSTTTKKNKHEKVHTGPCKKWSCPHCGLEFGSDHYIRNRHLMKEHNISPATYKCDTCNTSFLLKSHLTRHTKKYHMLERNHSCSECGYTCFSKYSMRMHMLKHSGERKYKCDTCHKSYGRKGTLKEHIRIHSNDRRHKCSVCGTAFVQKCSLKSHMLSRHSMSLQENLMNGVMLSPMS